MANLTQNQQNAINQGSINTANANNIASGVVSAPTVPTTLNSTNTQSNPAIVVPPVPTDTTNHAGIIAGATAYTTPSGAKVDANGNLISSPTDTTTSTTTPEASTYQKSIDYIKGLVGLDTGKTAYSQSQEDIQAQNMGYADFNAINTEKTKLSKQIQALNFESQAIPMKLQEDATGRGITTAGLAPLQAGELRKNAIQALGIQSKYALISGDLETAQSTAQRAVDLKYKDLESEIEQKTKLLALDLPGMTAAETKQKEALALKNEQAKTELADKKKSQTDVINAAQDAAKNGIAGASQVASDALKLDPNSSTFKTDLATIQGKIPTNTVDQQIKAQQLTNEKLQSQKLQSDINIANQQEATVNPDVLQGMLNVYKSTGVLPAFGMSAKSPLRAQFYAALGTPEGSQIVSDAQVNKSVRAGLTTAYRTQQNQLSANETSINTLDKQLSLAKQYSDQVSRSDSPLIAKYQIALKNGVFGDPQTAALNNIVKTASYEFAKILSGAAASISGVTVNSQADAESLLNSAMSKGQFNTVIGLMKQEAQFRLNSQRDTITQLQKDMNNIGSLSKDLQTAPRMTTSGQVFDYAGAIKAGYNEAQIQEYLKSH